MMKRCDTAFRISYINLAVNVVLAIVKLSVGYLAGSSALISDGVHSVTDVFSSIVVLVGITVSSRHSDKKHPYGHERMECVAAVILSVLVCVTGVGIGVSGIQTIMNGKQETAVSFGGVALAAALMSIVIKEIMFRYTRRAAMKSDSSALLADAWHLRTDALSSLGSFIGIGGANMGLWVLDPIAAVMISLLIIKAAVSIFGDSMKKMTDRSCDEVLQKAIETCVKDCAGVCEVRELKTRLFGNRVFVEVTVDVTGEMSCREAFAIANSTASTVCRRFEEVKDCAVHIHPL